MSEETRKQIIKSIALGYNATQVAEIYGFNIDIIGKLIVDNEKEIDAVKRFVKEMEG